MAANLFRAKQFGAKRFAARVFLGGGSGGTASGATTTVATDWTYGGVALASTTLDYWVISAADQVVASGSATTNGAGRLTVTLPAQYSGDEVLVVVNNVAADMATATRFHGQQVATAA